MKTLSIFLMNLLLFLNISAQDKGISQIIRGKIIDKATMQPLIGANVYIPDSDPVKGTITNEKGFFALNDVPLGRVSLRIVYVGYLPVDMQNLVVTSGKELVINVEMEEKIIQGEEVTIKAYRDKAGSINKNAGVSARTFTVEESMRYAGARNDVARMAANYAGVNVSNDATNDIVVRGNAPNGLLWRLDGVEIPNPNHFGVMGSTGGPVSMLNNNVLANSDFLTAAFPAEYMNAFSGVFDLKMRNGNYDKHEFLGQIGFNGFELGAEGPLSRKNYSSYLINYRYSTLGVLKNLGVDFGTGTAIPEYQDLSMKLNIPTAKAGKFTLTALGGINSIEFINTDKEEDDPDSFYDTDYINIYNDNYSGAVILNHVYSFSEKTYSNLSLALTGIMNDGKVDSISTEDRSILDLQGRRYDRKDIHLNFSLNHKLSARDQIKGGIRYRIMDYDLVDSIFYNHLGEFRTLLDEEGNTGLVQGFVHWQHKFTEKLILNTGLGVQQLTLNEHISLEPRANLIWNFYNGQRLNLGYGLHSKVLPLNFYFSEHRAAGGEYVRVNTGLKSPRAHHMVLGYDRIFRNNWRIKTEAYYQSVYDAVTEVGQSYYSSLNYSQQNFVMPDSMNNEGKGRNFGVELTVEKFLTSGFYFLGTLSVFDSKYAGSNGIWKPTAFDSDYVLNVLGGYELEIMKKGKSPSKKWLVLDGRISAAGGQRYTPVDLEASRESNTTVFNESQTNSKQFRDYFRADLKAGIRIDGKKASQEFAVDIQNITNHENPLYHTFDVTTGEINTINQLGLFPMVQYRIVF